MYTKQMIWSSCYSLFCQWNKIPETDQLKAGEVFGFLKIFSFIHMCIQCLGHFFPPPFLFPSLPGRNYFALISDFVEERVEAIIGRTKGFCWLR
jgi:hypothetical protein